MYHILFRHKYSTVVKGRATTADPVMKFLCELGDNGVVWNVLSYWSARLY